MTVGLEGPWSSTALRCPKCSLPFEPAAADFTESIQCSSCLSELSVALFPAFQVPPEEVSTAGGKQAEEGEAVCFFHPEKRAETSCAQCGRFICALCDMPLGGRHLCPKCLDGSKVPELINRRFVGSYFAMLLGVLPIIFLPISVGCFYLLPMFGGAAVGFAIWSWRKPGSLVHGPRHGMAIWGLIGGVLQLLGFAAMVAGIVYGIRYAS